MARIGWNSDIGQALSAALEAGAFRPRDACRAIRALYGLSQADLAAELDLSIKVIRSLESGNGNPQLESLKKIAGFAGLKVAFVRPPFDAGLFDPAERKREEERQRDADYAAIASGQQSARERDVQNAMHISEAHVEWPSLS